MCVQIKDDSPVLSLFFAHGLKAPSFSVVLVTHCILLSFVALVWLWLGLKRNNGGDLNSNL